MMRIEANTPFIEPPTWAVLERHLIELMDGAVAPIMERYVHPDGRIMWPTRDDHVTIDGLDDAYESFHNWPLVCALGGGDHLGELGQREYDAITQQFTRYDTGHGHPMVVKEYEQGYDWMHQGEGYLLFYVLSLVSPDHPVNVERAQRYAGFYLNEDPDAQLYDFERRLLRSPHVGSMGPGWRNFDRHYTQYRYQQWKSRPLPFHDLPGISSVEDLRDNPEAEAAMGQAMVRRMARGDVVCNLAATTLITHAYLHTGDDKYKRWVCDYTQAWMERAAANGGIVPDNVGLSGQIGEYIDGKWYGGYYGWTWPSGWGHVGEEILIACENATLMTGDTAYVDFARSQIQYLVDQGREVDGTWHVPQFHHDGGWDRFGPMHARFTSHLWCLSQDAGDAELAARLRDHGSRDYERVVSHFSKHGGNHEAAWLAYLRGEYPGYPVDILRHTQAQVYQRLAFMADDRQDPSTYSDAYLQLRNPVFAEALVQLTTGAPLMIYQGGLHLGRLRYFDIDRRRAGLPTDVGALVTSIADDSCEVELVNLHPSEARHLIVQAGTFAEHAFTDVSWTTREGDDETPRMHAEQHLSWVRERIGERRTDVGGPHLRVDLAPATGVRLRLGMRRFVNTPSYAFPNLSGASG